MASAEELTAFGAENAFIKQFTPVRGGYLYYPSAKSGGKLVTPEERDHLLEIWRKAAGTRAAWRAAGGTLFALAIWMFVADAAGLPTWADLAAIIVITAIFCARMLWVSLEPRRLVRERPAVAPPRSPSKARREARILLTWPFVLFSLLTSGLGFAGSLISVITMPRPLNWVVCAVVGFIFTSYIWLAFQKYRDRHSDRSDSERGQIG